MSFTVSACFRCGSSDLTHYVRHPLDRRMARVCNSCSKVFKKRKAEEEESLAKRARPAAPEIRPNSLYSTLADRDRFISLVQQAAREGCLFEVLSLPPGKPLIHSLIQECENTKTPEEAAAAFEKFCFVVDVLKREGGDPLWYSWKDQNQYSALHLALNLLPNSAFFSTFLPEMIRILREHSPPDILKWRAGFGDTVLHVIVRRNLLGLLKLFSDEEIFSALSIRDNGGFTPLDSARNWKQTAMVDQLLKIHHRVITAESAKILQAALIPEIVADYAAP